MYKNKTNSLDRPHSSKKLWRKTADQAHGCHYGKKTKIPKRNIIVRLESGTVSLNDISLSRVKVISDHAENLFSQHTCTNSPISPIMIMLCISITFG